MPIGTEIGLGPGDIVLDGEPAPPPAERSTAASTFWPILLWLNGWIRQDTTWYGGRPRYIVHTKPVIAILVPKLVAIATSFRPSISAMSSSDSLSQKTYP